MEATQIAALKEKTVVYEETPDVIEPISWRKFDAIEEITYEIDTSDLEFQYELIENAVGLTPDYSKGLKFYIGIQSKERDNENKLSTDSLPIEFFNHQLFETYTNKKNKENPDATLLFMEEWGLLFSPLRNNWGCLDGWQFLEAMSMQGVKETDFLLEHAPELCGKAVSKLEADTTRVVLQEIVYFLRKHIRSGGADISSLQMIRGPLNASSCYPLQLIDPSVDGIKDASLSAKELLKLLNREATSEEEALLDSFIERDRLKMSRFEDKTLSEMGLLTSAICNQIIQSVRNTNLPWRECAYEKCDVIFKYSQSEARTPNADSAYCCPKHSDNQRQIKQYRKQKAKRN